MNDFLGLFFQFAFFLIGLYFYLLAVGRVKLASKESAEFVQQNRRWMRPIALALMAIMFLNIVLQVTDMLKR
jgi:hypothetical protein